MKALSAVAILEKDVNGDVLQVWSYPSVESDVESVIKIRSALDKESIPIQFSFSKYKNEWLYIFIQLNESPYPDFPSQLSKPVQAFATALITTDFHPEKYFELSKLMAMLYLVTGDPLKTLECYLSVFAKGSYNAGKLGTFKSDQHDIKTAYLATSIKDVARMFGDEFVILWSALIMKKRVVVYSDKPSLLLKVIRSFPLLVWHRQNWDLLRPFMTLSEPEIKDIKQSKIYVAGFVEEEVRDREDLYDIFVDINNRSVSVASHAKSDFNMTLVHKDIADFVASKVEDAESADGDIIKGITMKTKELLGKIEKLKTEHEDGNSYVDLQTLENTKLPPNMDRFLYAVAAAEGMTKI